MHPLRVGLAGFVDYAGLFPPAGLDLPTVLANVERYVASPERWLLGRVVVPLGKLEECAALLTAGAPRHELDAWTVSVLVQPGDALRGVAAAIETFEATLVGRRIQVTSVEAAAAETADGIDDLAALPGTLERYVEVAVDRAFEPLLDRIAHCGCAAKVRTGGLTPDRVPGSADLARFIVACRERNVPFKATAGLHHALRASHPLTYEASSGFAVMHGFVNLLAATALLHGRHIEPSQVARVLDEQNGSAFGCQRDGLRWRDALVSIQHLSECRARLLRSVGSCSFEEPVEDLRQLGWWPG